MNDLSRGALVEDIIYTVALTAIQARASSIYPERSRYPPGKPRPPGVAVA